MSDSIPQSAEAVAYHLMEKLLLSDGKICNGKGNTSAATREEIKIAFREAADLISGIKQR